VLVGCEGDAGVCAIRLGRIPKGIVSRAARSF
jgi:hypothetical protein